MLFPLLLAGASVAAAAAECGCSSKLFDNLVTFGDSYTDDGRLSYYINNKGQGPPPGVYPATINVTASGGLTWAQYVARYTGANFRDYAVDGATCSNEIISRYFSAINRSFPSVMDDEMPSYKADIAFKSLYPDRTAENTVYALWIGTNDLGWQGFLSDSQAPGTDISTYVDCVWSVFDSLYQTGGRRFVLFNMAPLQLHPMYAPQSEGGIGDGQYWTNHTLYNVTEYQYKIMEYTTNVNTIFEYGVPFQTLVMKRWPGAGVDIYNVHKLLVDIYNDPSSYLDPPAISKGFYHHCNPLNTSDCTNMSSEGPLSGFMFYDELHPSTKTGKPPGHDWLLDVCCGTPALLTSHA